ncbi:MAG: coproporphyrinogen III oxidase [Silicimonas sp.]|nr:coproporphyrinogen III oxidase [Silicimonas sp.]
MANGFGLYVHWPFCQAKCPYCDFNSHVTAQIDQARWLAAYESEIARVRDDSGPRVLNSIFFGGGTPSLMEGDTVAGIIAAARAAWSPANDIEITLEANPTSVEAARFRAYADAGVNRVSIGVQSLRDDHLKALGRLHSADEARRAVETAEKHFPRVSFDLIYGRQHQALADWKEELTEALQMAAGHLSLYHLTIEPDTAFGDRHARGRLPGLPDEDLSADMFDLTQDMTGAAGLPMYEISNHSTPGAESIHNLIYWRSGDWAGVGPGAHGRLTLGGERNATECHMAPSAWLKAVESNRDGTSLRRVLAHEDARIEAVMMGLRLAEGVPASLLTNVSKINELEDLRLLESDDTTVRVTPRGRPLLNAVLRDLL